MINKNRKVYASCIEKSHFLQMILLRHMVKLFSTLMIFEGVNKNNLYPMVVAFEDKCSQKSYLVL